MLAFLSKKTGEHYPVKRKALRGGAKKAFGNKYSDGLDYDLEKGSVTGFMETHTKHTKGKLGLEKMVTTTHYHKRCFLLCSFGC